MNDIVNVRNKQNLTLAKAQKALKTATIWFVCLLILVLAVAIGNTLSGSGNNAGILVAGFILLATPIFLSFVYACIAIKQIRLCKKAGFTIPKSMHILSIVLALQIPLLAAIFMCSSIIKPMVAVRKVETYFSESHTDNYEILESCHHFDSSVNDYTKVVLKVEGLSEPVTAKYSWTGETYEDNYDIIKSGSKSDLPSQCDGYR